VENEPINVKPSPPAVLALAMARDSVIPAARQGIVGERTGCLPKANLC
jgi:hypothetical protein